MYNRCSFQYIRSETVYMICMFASVINVHGKNYMYFHCMKIRRDKKKEKKRRRKKNRDKYIYIKNKNKQKILYKKKMI